MRTDCIRLPAVNDAPQMEHVGLAMVFALYIERELARKRWTQGKLAEELGMSKGMVSGWASGRGAETANMERVMRAFGLSTTDALGIMADCAQAIADGYVPRKVAERLEREARAVPGAGGRAFVARSPQAKGTSAASGRRQPTKGPHQE